MQEPFKSTQTWNLKCVKLYRMELESGGRVQGPPQQAILLSDAHIFCDCNARKCIRVDVTSSGGNEKKVTKGLTSTVSCSLCTIGLDSPGLVSDLTLWAFWFFRKLAFFYDASEMLHPVCATDTSLINQWNVNMTARISSCSVLQTLLGERKGNFWCM